MADHFELWNSRIRFEIEEESEYQALDINDDDGNSIYRAKIYGSQVDIIDIGAGENGADFETLSLKLDARKTQPDPNQAQIPHPPKTKYRTSSVTFSKDMENPPTVRLYCLDNHSFELHVFSPADQVYKVYSFCLKVDNDKDTWKVDLKNLNDGSSTSVLNFKKRFFSTSDAIIDFNTPVTHPTLQLLMAAIAYLRFTNYGYSVYKDNNDPNRYDPKVYQEEEETVEALRAVSEKIKTQYGKK